MCICAYIYIYIYVFNTSDTARQACHFRERANIPEPLLKSLQSELLSC